ncbi:hypothetical protein H4J63_10325 [Pseudoalteromonas sp. 5Ae-yellow]|uniref:hypothetical protein n=1 Tax=Pseudoalteromonas sp. 5Ae-yellow TaxID=2759847 RepID=UPI0015F41605|nr:hypothetical protein [Pseudoalteromonas sp. 5Ae-yellow]MBA6409711.1 hypothetical protein [Pseudoalteromonas sp. 5Ae-yellow]
MAVNWQGVYSVITTQFNANNAVNFASTVNDELNNEGVHGIIELVTADNKVAVISLYNEASASHFDLTKFNLE